MADLSGFAEKIAADEDRPLFEDAVKSAQANVLRGAYVMIWLACAESLKRRFREAQRYYSEVLLVTVLLVTVTDCLGP